jgi:hypothetical protein
VLWTGPSRASPWLRITCITCATNNPLCPITYSAGLTPITRALGTYQVSIICICKLYLYLPHLMQVMCAAARWAKLFVVLREVNSTSRLDVLFLHSLMRVRIQAGEGGGDHVPIRPCRPPHEHRVAANSSQAGVPSAGCLSAAVWFTCADARAIRMLLPGCRCAKGMHRALRQHMCSCP